ncbi:MAG: GNAT family N-acetyltransferase [Pseudomonadota bacterium]|nr:GNAT family N-acetyltransferase [Pseudomonadota bacterium]
MLPTDVTYREGPPVDPVALERLFTAVGFNRSRDPAHLTAMVEGARWAVSAWVGGELVGFARAVSDGVSIAYVSTVAVHPDHQRRGVGRELMRRLVEGRGGVKFVVHTSPAGERLYRSLGFVDATQMLVLPRS